MSQSDIPKCPRCGQEVEITMSNTIRKHTDALVGSPCPTGGMDYDDAGRWVKRTRQALLAGEPIR